MSVQARLAPPAPATPPRSAPPLRSGDRLTVTEFARRYEAMPPGTKAELIKGVVYVSSPVSLDHAESHPVLITVLGMYTLNTPGVLAGDNATMRLDDDESQPQADCHLRIDPALGGRTRSSPDGYLEGVPELVAEVAVTSANYDLHDKLDVYREHGVQEYVVWRVWDRAVDWFRLRGDRFERLSEGADGVSRSEVFPGLWIDTAALARDDRARIFQVTLDGFKSPEHAAFVQQLRERAAQQSGGTP
jgi:Uma2 family endonuclease